MAEIEKGGQEKEGIRYLRLLNLDHLIGKPNPIDNTLCEDFLDNPKCRQFALPVLRHLETLPDNDPSILIISQQIEQKFFSGTEAGQADN